MPRARAAGALVLLDAKRGDIGSTMDAYADYLRPDHPLAVDAMTVSPYLGPGSLQPAVDTARHVRRRAVRAGPHLQPRRRHLPARASVGERSVAQVVVDTVRGWNTPGWVVGDPLPDIAAVRDLASRFGPTTGSFGVVVGATLREHGRRPRRAGRPDPRARASAPRAARSADLRRLFGTGRAVVPTVSRDVLAPAPTRPRCGRPPTGGRRSSPAERARPGVGVSAFRRVGCPACRGRRPPAIR